MTSLPSALARAIGQLPDPAILRVLVKSIAITAVIIGLLGLAGWYLLSGMIEEWQLSFGAELGALAAVLITVIAGWLLFRVVALAVLQFFADEIVHAVETRHYPQALTSARKLSLQEEMRNSMRSTVRVVLANLVALPFAIALLITGIGTAILFLAVNGWLLGRELQDMVWLRHANASAGKPPIGPGTRFALGGIVAILLTIPVVNFLAPVIGAAAATHLVHRRKRPT